MDLDDIAESFRRGLQEIPPVLIGLALLGGPTIGLVVWRFFGVARRMQGSGDRKATPFWVCRDCRSVNEMRLARCYRCALPRDATRVVEIIIDRPGYRPVPLVVPIEAVSDAPAASVAPAVSATPESPATSGPTASAAPVASLARAARGRKSSGKAVMAQTADVDPVAVGPGHEADATRGGAPTTEEAGAAVEAES